VTCVSHCVRSLLIHRSCDVGLCFALRSPALLCLSRPCVAMWCPASYGFVTHHVINRRHTNIRTQSQTYIRYARGNGPTGIKPRRCMDMRKRTRPRVINRRSTAGVWYAYQRTHAARVELRASKFFFSCAPVRIDRQCTYHCYAFITGAIRSRSQLYAWAGEHTHTKGGAPAHGPTDASAWEDTNT
jgi:hypothetical protein